MVFWQAFRVHELRPFGRQRSGAIVTPALPEVGRAASGRLSRRALEWFARVLFGRYLTTEVDGCDHLPAGPLLICSNHASHLDSAALMISTGRPFGTFRLLAAADYFTPQSLAGRVTRAFFDIVAVDRGGRHATRLRQTVAACRAQAAGDGVCFIAFPEGTRSTTGRLLPFKRGAAFLAVELGMPVVPALVSGTATALPKGRWLPRRARIVVRFGRPILPDDWATRHGRGASAAYVAAEVERRVRSLAAEADSPAASSSLPARPPHHLVRNSAASHVAGEGRRRIDQRGEAGGSHERPIFRVVGVDVRRP